MKSEKLKEGWVEFERYYFKEGYIDRFMTDQANDPNRNKPNTIQFNAYTSYIRLNNGKWINTRAVGGMPYFIQLLRFTEEYTAEEVWAGLIDKQQFSLNYKKQIIK